MSFIKDKNIRRRSISCVFLLLILLAIFLFTDATEEGEIFQHPTWRHLFGTDQLGRDMFVRCVHGVIYSFFIAFLINVLSFFFGNLLGIALGYYGGRWDELYHYLLNFLMSVPMTIVYLSVIAMLGRGMMSIILVLVPTNILLRARMPRNEIMIIKNSDYILNLRILGAKDSHIIFHHLMPHVWKLTLPLFAMMLGHTVITVSGFSFLGFGVQPPKADIGLLMKDSLRFTRQAPWLMILPGIFQVFVILLFNRWAEAIGKAMELRKRKV